MATRIRIQEFKDGNLVQQFDLEPMEPAELDWATIPVDSHNSDETMTVARPQYHVVTLKVMTVNGRFQRCLHDTIDDCTCAWKGMS